MHAYANYVQNVKRKGCVCGAVFSRILIGRVKNIEGKIHKFLRSGEPNSGQKEGVCRVVSLRILVGVALNVWQKKDY